MRRMLAGWCGVVMYAGLAAAGPYGTSGGGRCPDALGSNVYACNVKGSDGSAFVDCYRFSTSGQVSSKFDLHSDRLGATIGCACGPLGPAGSPSFGGSSAFTCTNDLGVAFEGRVGKNGKLTNAKMTNASGDTYSVACSRNDGCALP